jgi:heptaprenyl diphosphate synthase
MPSAQNEHSLARRAAGRGGAGCRIPHPLAYPGRSVDAVLPSDPFALPIPTSDLDRLEESLRLAVIGDDPFLNEVASHLIGAGGKRLRPALTIAAASLGGAAVGDDTLLGGVSVELVHLASLYHDDVMDEATRRRGVESVNARWGNLVAVVAGDFLLARSAEIAASLGTEIAGLLAATLARLCHGQVAEVRSAYSLERDEKDYLGAIADKTAALMATACRIGGLTAGLDRARVEALTTFGECFGMVFQIRDDILDILATEEMLGKAPGQDLVEGVYTLPVIRALVDPGSGPELGALLGKRLDVDQLAEARELVANSSGIAAAEEVAARYAAEAAEAASALGGGPVAEALARLGTGLVDAPVR